MAPQKTTFSRPLVRLGGWRGQEVPMKDITSSPSSQDSLSSLSSLSSEAKDFLLSGPAFIRKRFPHRITVIDLSTEMGISRSHLYKRLNDGTLNIPVHRNEMGRPFVMTDDVIAYLYPSFKPLDVSPAVSPAPVAPEESQKRKRGRPRKPPVT